MVVLDVHWFDKTFSSQDKAESVLRPYLEAGTINEHDYNLAVSFLPGNHRYWPILYSIGATVLTASYGRFAKRPPWSINRMVAIASTANVFGFLVGQVQRASAHQQFIKSLDDRQGFIDTLRHIAGEDPQAQQLPGHTTAVYPIPKDEHGAINAPRRAEDFVDPTVTPWSEDPNSSPSGPSSSAPARPPPGKLTLNRHDSFTLSTDQAASVTEHPRVTSRWDEIRAANARAGRSSTWDALRQNHERRQIPGSVQPAEDPSIPPPLNDADAERAREQARFDALLDAERKAAGRSV